MIDSPQKIFRGEIFITMANRQTWPMAHRLYREESVDSHDGSIRHKIFGKQRRDSNEDWISRVEISDLPELKVLL
jgi:hypothetical protein